MASCSSNTYNNYRNKTRPGVVVICNACKQRKKTALENEIVASYDITRHTPFFR